MTHRYCLHNQSATCPRTKAWKNLFFFFLLFFSPCLPPPPPRYPSNNSPFVGSSRALSLSLSLTLCLYSPPLSLSLEMFPPFFSSSRSHDDARRPAAVPGRGPSSSSARLSLVSGLLLLLLFFFPTINRYVDSICQNYFNPYRSPTRFRVVNRTTR